jgi:hypothetical protein
MIIKHKFIPYVDTLLIPRGARILAVEVDGNGLVLVTDGSSDEVLELRTFRVYGPGEEPEGVYVGSAGGKYVYEGVHP